jgi:hypothetical protein
MGHATRMRAMKITTVVLLCISIVVGVISLAKSSGYRFGSVTCYNTNVIANCNYGASLYLYDILMIVACIVMCINCFIDVLKKFVGLEFMTIPFGIAVVSVGLAQIFISGVFGFISGLVVMVWGIVIIVLSFAGQHKVGPTAK